MSQITISRSIYAPVETVFRTVSEINTFSKAVPEIVDVEILSETKVGTGTRFRETRLINGKKASTELEVTEFVENERIRLVADSHGTIWDSVFTVAPAEDRTNLTLTMEAKAYKLLPKLLNPLMKGIVRRAVEKDLDAVKEFCER